MSYFLDLFSICQGWTVLVSRNYLLYRTKTVKINESEKFKQKLVEIKTKIFPSSIILLM